MRASPRHTKNAGTAFYLKPDTPEYTRYLDDQLILLKLPGVRGCPAHNNSDQRKPGSSRDVIQPTEHQRVWWRAGTIRMAGLGKRLAMGPEGMPRYSRWAAAPPAAADRGQRKRRGWVNPGSQADPLAVHPVYNPRRDGCGSSGAGLCWILPNRARPGLPSGQLPAKP